jgi:Oxygen-sensitive ribonucleoside-triphosphate reductase
LRRLVVAHPAARRLNGVPGKVEAGPPKHMSSAVGQIVNFLGTLQNEWAGAQASPRSTPTWRRSSATMP